MSESPPESSTSEGGVGFLGAVAIGIGGMVGGGIFAVLGTAVGLAGGATPLAFGVAGLVALLTSYSYAKLSVRYPRAGGTMVYLDEAFGINTATGSLNLLLWLSYLVTIALYAAAFGSYGLTFFSEPAPWVRHALISGAILLPALINVFDSSIVTRSESAVVVLKLSLLAVVIVAGLGHVDPARLAPSTWSAPLSIVVAGMVIFVAYEGFELIANSAEEIRDPERTLPRAFYACVTFVILLYVLVACVTVGSVDAETITQAKDYALAEAAKPALGKAGFVLVSVSALLATLSAINATIYGNARLGFSLASEGELPAWVAKRVCHRPVYGVLVTTLLSLLCANLIDLEAIAILGSAGFLLIFTLVNAAAFKLGAEIGALRPLAAAATLASALALTALLWHTFQTTPHALYVFLGLLAFALAFEFVFPRLRRGHPGPD